MEQQSPRGLGSYNMPVAEDEAHVMLFEPQSTVDTGSAESDRTVSELERIQLYWLVRDLVGPGG